RGVGEDHLRSVAGYLRRTAAGFFLGGARSHGTQPAGSRRGNAISVARFLWQRGEEEECPRVIRAARPGQSVSAGDRNPGCAAEGVLSGGGLSSGLCDA